MSEQPSITSRENITCRKQRFHLFCLRSRRNNKSQPYQLQSCALGGRIVRGQHALQALSRDIKHLQEKS